MKKPAPSNIGKLLGIIVGYFLADVLTNPNFNGSPYYGWSLGLFSLILAVGAVIAVKFPGLRLRRTYKQSVGQLGVWLTSLIIGGVLPLVKMAVYSFDFWVWVIFLTIYGVVLYGCLLLQEWFEFPRTP